MNCEYVESDDFSIWKISPGTESFSLGVHRRFCHLNTSLINNMSKKNIVNGIENVHGEIGTCNTCKLSKATRSSFKGISEIKTKEILDRVYMDVKGLSPVESLGGSRYFLSIIDDFSRKTFIYVLQRKSEVFKYFKEFLAKVERQCNKKLKCIRTDNGMEFCSIEFEKFLRDRGIKMERTSTYSPEQNGIAERFNRTAIEGVNVQCYRTADYREDSGRRHYIHSYMSRIGVSTGC